MSVTTETSRSIRLLLGYDVAVIGLSNQQQVGKHSKIKIQSLSSRPFTLRFGWDMKIVLNDGTAQNLA
jgi:hypothetical protein